MKEKLIAGFIIFHLLVIGFVSTHLNNYLPAGAVTGRVHAVSVLYSRLTGHNLRYSLFAPGVTKQLIPEVTCIRKSGMAYHYNLTKGVRELEIRSHRVFQFIYNEQLAAPLLHSWTRYLHLQDPQLKTVIFSVYEYDTEPMRAGGRVFKRLYFQKKLSA